MIGFRHNNVFFDINPNATVSFELNSPIFFGDSDPSFIPGSFSLPILFPATPKNKDKFNHAELIDSFQNVRTLSDVSFYAMGVHFYTGTLYILDNGRFGYKCSFLINYIDKAKDLKLREANLGEHIEADGAAMKQKALDICNAPHTSDFGFFTVFNPSFYEEKNENLGYNLQNHQNYYSWSEYGFDYPTEEYAGVTPFLSVRFLLEKSAEILGLTLINHFQTDDELNSLFVYNNHSTHYKEAWYRYIKFANHAPNIKASDFIKAIASMFFCAVEIDVNKKTLEIFKLKDVVTSSVTRNWTAYAARDYSVNDLDVTRKISYPDDTPFLAQYVGNYEELQNVNSLINANAGTYYIKASDSFYKKTSSGPVSDYFLLHKKYAPILLNGLKDAVTLHVSPMYMKLDSVSIPQNGGLAYGYPGEYPFIKNVGTINYIDPNDHDNDYEQKEPFPFQLAFFRGWEEHPNTVVNSGIQFPYANVHSYNSRGQQYYNYSLLMNAERGIENVFASSWIYALRKARKTKRRLNLTLGEISSFSFKEKIRIENMHFLVKSMKVTFSSEGIKPVEATLISV